MFHFRLAENVRYWDGNAVFELSGLKSDNKQGVCLKAHL